MGIQLNKENPISECMERNGTKQNYNSCCNRHMCRRARKINVVVVKLFPSIHPSRHPSMDGIAWPVHPSVPSSIHGWHHTGKKTLAKINNPPSAHVSLYRKGMPGLGLRSFTMVSCMLLSHRSQALQTSRFSAARVPMDTFGMWYIERFWKCSL
jgi:hypothetical protein